MCIDKPDGTHDRGRRLRRMMSGSTLASGRQEKSDIYIYIQISTSVIIVGINTKSEGNITPARNTYIHLVPTDNISLHKL